MGELLLNWLNDEIQLSKRITNFEQDFHNGFLFGELLAKYSQQLNFHQFIDKDDKASRVKNFSFLLETLTALRVTYDANTAFKIINRQLGVAKKLLYELKTQLEKTNDNVFSKTNKLSKTLTPLKKIQISKEKFDQVQKEHFVKQLNELHPAQKQIIQHQLLRKFNDFQLNSTIRAAQEEEKEMQSKLSLRNKFYQQQRDNLKKSQEFRKQWQAQNRDKWANNMTIRQIQISKDTQFKQRQQDLKIKTKTNSEANALKALQSDIAAFQRKNLKSRKGRQIQSDDEEPPKELSNTKTKEKEKAVLQVREQKRLPNVENQKKKHQRQKRRRKMIVQQMKKYQLIEINRRQRCIISTIEQTSKQQKEIQYEIWRAWQNKNIIIQNKAIQTEKMREKEETRTINAKFKKDQLLKTYREEHKKEVDQALVKMTHLQRVHQAKSRKGIYSKCQKMVNQLLEITEKMYVSAQERNSKHLDQLQLQAQFVKFVQGTADQDESSLRLKHYIQGSHQWNITIVRPQEEVSSNPKDDNALPNQTVNNYYLGNILKTVFEKYYENQVDKKGQVRNDRLVIALLGLQFARKHQIAAFLSEKYEFQVIEVEKLIEQKLTDWLQFKKKGIEASKETDQIAAQCFNGKQLDDKAIVKLVSETVQNTKKAIILDFPNTYEQAIELCNLISGIQPNDLLQKDKLKNKIEEFSKLVKPNDAKVIQRQIRGCGIDFVWWINVSPQNSFDRMLGRRWIKDNVVNIYDQVDPQQLRQGQKASALAMRNHFKLKNKSGLENWFNLFGIKVEEGNKNCWESIQGNIDNSSLQNTIIQKVSQSIKIKQEQRLKAIKQEEQNKKNQEQHDKQQKQKLAIKQKCCKANPQNLKSQLSVALNKVEIDKQFISQIAEVWNRIESTTINSFKKVFQSLSQQQKSKRYYLAHLKRNFIALLTRADHKFHLIKDFQTNYNQFLTQNQDMLAFQYTKEELHQRVEDLQNDLLALVDEKKEDAISERNSIMTSGWLEAQIDLIYQCLYLLVQSELNRFAVSQKIIVDFYAKKFMCNAKTFEPLAPEINNQAYTSLQSYKDNACPKLDKIISEAIRILNREEEVVDDKNKKGGKGAPPKKEQKKAAKKGGKQEVEEVKQPTPQQIQLKAAVNTQKAILRQRLNRIKTLGYKILSQTSVSAYKLYTELEDLYVYTHKVEQKAIFGLSKIFKRAIQNQQKIQNQVQIKHVEVIHTELIRNFQKQKPIILPAKEQTSDSHFTLSNLQQIFKLVSNQAEVTKISTKRLTVLLSKLINNQSMKKLTPKSWKSLKVINIQSFVKTLDRSNLAYVNLAELFMFLALIGFSIPSVAQIEEYTLNLSNYSSLKQVNQQKFMQTKCWFDQQIVIEENVRVFNRNKEIKRVLFNIFKNEDNLVQIATYLSAINLQALEKIKSLKREGQTYFDAAFA